MIDTFHYITQGQTPSEHLSATVMACEAGVRWVQLRLKDEPVDLVLEVARAAKDVCDLFEAKLIVNDFPMVAKAVGADGVHLGKEDMSPAEARKLLGQGFLIGGTANTLEDCERLARQQVNYIGLGPFRFTTTKKKLSPVLGLDGYRSIMKEMKSRMVQVPVIAIGGLQLQDLYDLRQLGIHGIAVSGLLTHAKEKQQTFLTCKDLFIMNVEPLKIADKSFSSRLFTGTGKFSSSTLMEEAILASQSELVTVALRRVEVENEEDDLLVHLQHSHLHLLPNTSGARDAKEAVFAAQLAREALDTNWVKLEIHPDPRYLLPDPIETLKAAEELVKQGFVVMPYIHADPVLCKRLEEAGTQCVMPLGAPIGSNKGLETLDFLEIIVNQSTVPVVVDAGIGAPSHAAQAMEIGADAVLVNTAIAVSNNPVEMSCAFKLAVEAGRMAYEAKLAPVTTLAEASSPLTGFLTGLM